jgi:hypothetical protein
MSIGASHNDRWDLSATCLKSSKARWQSRISSPCSGKKNKGQNTDRISREMAMEKKLMFVAFGYLLLLAALDAGVAAMIVSG